MRSVSSLMISMTCEWRKPSSRMLVTICQSGSSAAGAAAMSGAAVNIIVAPWFERRRGLALSWAMNGGSAGGVLLAPLLIVSISQFGFAVGLDIAAALMLAFLIPVTMLLLRPRRPNQATS